MPKAEETILEIDLSALRHNYEHIRSKLKEETKILAVVKAFGYGSDAIEVAKKLASLGVDYFAVAYAKEGEVLRNAGIETPIIVLHPLPVNFDVIVNRCLEPSLYSETMLSSFISYAEQQQQKNYPIHLKFNTGLNRLGFGEKEIESISKVLNNSSSIKIKSIFSHLAASEDLNEKAFTETQIKHFDHISKKVISLIGYEPILHLLNTSGIFNYPESQYDMVRTGIGLYGFANDLEEDKQLKPIASLKTVISQLHTIQKGETIGYNRALTASHEMRTATLPLGHADGISRAYGNGKGWVIINGQKAAIVGNVCMDMLMVDVTNINCNQGDEVIVFGATPTAEELTAVVGTISYELLTAISQRVKRRVT